jgi:hypothetical protein
VKVPGIAVQHIDRDVLGRGAEPAHLQANASEQEMPRTILSLAGLWQSPSSRCDSDDGAVSAEDMRAVATEGALAAAADASPAVLVSLWAHDQRLHREGRPRRGR